jgi:hypothetical protein
MESAGINLHKKSITHCVIDHIGAIITVRVGDYQCDERASIVAWRLGARQGTESIAANEHERLTRTHFLQRRQTRRHRCRVA